MHYAFQDRENLYLIIDLMNGGDLRFWFAQKRKFSEAETSKYFSKNNFYQEFFAACIIDGLEYLHEKCILHRDIKPENLVFDDKGYLKITDMGIAK